MVVSGPSIPLYTLFGTVGVVTGMGVVTDGTDGKGTMSSDSLDELEYRALFGELGGLGGLELLISIPNEGLCCEVSRTVELKSQGSCNAESSS